MCFTGDGLLVGVWFIISQLILPSSTLSDTPCIYEHGKPVEAPFPNDGTDRIAWAKEGVAKHNERRKELGITGLPDIVFNPKMCGGAQWVSNKVATPGQPNQLASNMDFVTTQCEDVGCKSGRSETPSLASDISSCWLQYQTIKVILTAAREMCMVYSGDGLGNWFYSAVFFPKPPPPPLFAPPCIYENGKPVEAPFPNDGTDRIAWGKKGVAKHNERRKELGITGLPDIVFNPNMCGGAQWVSNKVATPGQPHQRASNMDFVTTQCEDIGCKSGRSESPSLASDISSCWLQYQNIKDILTAAREMCMVYSGDGLGNWFYSAVFFPKPPPPPRSAPPCIYENGKPVDTPLPTDIDRIAWAKEGVAKHNERRKELGITGIPDIMFNPKMCGAAQWVTNKYAIPGDPFLFASEMDSVSMQCAEFNCALGPSTTSPPASVISGCWLDNFSHVDRARVIEVLIAAREMCITYTHDGQAAFFYTVHFYPPPPKPHDPGAVVNPEGRSGFYTTPTPRSKTPRPKPQLAPPPPPVASYTFVV